jgi:hypothetical protein
VLIVFKERRRGKRMWNLYKMCHSHPLTSLFESVRIVDPSSLQDFITNVIERWGFGLEVKHQTQTQVA